MFMQPVKTHCCNMQHTRKSVSSESKVTMTARGCRMKLLHRTCLVEYLWKACLNLNPCFSIKNKSKDLHLHFESRRTSPVLGTFTEINATLCGQCPLKILKTEYTKCLLLVQ
jgi:hypothetical protein